MGQHESGSSNVDSFTVVVLVVLVFLLAVLACGAVGTKLLWNKRRDFHNSGSMLSLLEGPVTPLQLAGHSCLRASIYQHLQLILSLRTRKVGDQIKWSAYQASRTKARNRGVSQKMSARIL